MSFGSVCTRMRPNTGGLLIWFLSSLTVVWLFVFHHFYQPKCVIWGYDKFSLSIFKKRNQITSRFCSSVVAWLFDFFSPLRAALAATSKLYDSVDDALHRLVRVSNQRGRDLEALGRLVGLVDKLEKVCEGGRRWVWFYSHFRNSAAYCLSGMSLTNLLYQFKIWVVSNFCVRHCTPPILTRPPCFKEGLHRNSLICWCCSDCCMFSLKYSSSHSTALSCSHTAQQNRYYSVQCNTICWGKKRNTCFFLLHVNVSTPLRGFSSLPHVQWIACVLLSPLSPSLSYTTVW